MNDQGFFRNWVVTSGLLLSFIMLVFSVIVAPINAVKSTPNGQGHCGTGWVEKDEDTKSEIPGIGISDTDENGFEYHGSYTITSVYIKTGKDKDTDSFCFYFSSDTNDGCYSISGIGSSNVLVTKVGSGSECKDISHVEFYNSTPTPSPTPSPTPYCETECCTESCNDPSPSPSVTPDPTPTPVASETPTPTNTSTPDPNAGKHSSLGKNGPTCTDPRFEVTFDLREDGRPVKDVEVTINYRGDKRTHKTNEGGRVQVFYTYGGAGDVVATANDNYPGQSIRIEELNCPSSGIGGAVLGSSTGRASNVTKIASSSGKVLGSSTTTLAATGTFDETVIKAISGFISGMLVYMLYKTFFISA